MVGKKRVIKIHRVFSLVVAVVVTVVIAVGVFQKSELLSYRLSKYVNDHYLRGTPFRFSCGRISGDLVGHVSLARPVLRYQGKGRPFEVFRARRISLDYNLVQVLKLKMLVSNLEIEQPRLTILEGSDGRPLLPSPPNGANPSSESATPHVEIDRFSVTDLQLRVERTDVAHTLERVNLEGQFRLVEGEGQLSIDNGSAVVGGTQVPVSSLKMKATYGGDGVAFSGLEVRLDRTVAVLSGRYDEGRLHHVQGVFNPLDLAELSALGVIQGEKGEVGGNVIVEGPPDSLSLRGSLAGKGLGLVFSGLTFEGLLSPEEVYFSELQGTIFGSRLNGDFRYRRADGGYSFSGVCESLDITEGFIKDEGVPETDLNGFVKLDYLAPQKAYEVQADLRRSSVLGFEGDAIQCRLNWRDAIGLRIRSFQLSRPGFELSGSGTIDPAGTADLILDLKGDDFGYLLDYIELPPIGGSAELSGRLQGPLDRFQLNLNGGWRDLSYLWGTIDSSSVHADARNVGGEDILATVDVKGSGLMLKGKEFEDPHVLLEGTVGKVRVRDFSFATGDTFVTTSFDVVPGEEEQKILIQHLVVNMPHSNWKNELPTIMTVTDNSTAIDSLVLQSNGHSLGIVGSYSVDSETCDLRGWGENLDLALLRRAFDLPIELRGTARFEATATGDLNDPTSDLSLEIRDGSIDSLVFAYLDVRADYEPSRGYRVNGLRLRDGPDSLLISGTWALPESPVKMVRRGFPMSAAAGAQVKAEAASSRYPLPALFKALHLPRYWEGAFDGTMTVTNTLGAPVIISRGTLVSQPGDRRQLPPIRTDLQYENKVLTIRSVDVDDGATRARAQGTVPVAIGIGSGFEWRDDGPVDVAIRVASEDLSRVPGYFEAIAASRGRMQGELAIRGILASPTYTGNLELNEGGLRLAGMDEVYRDVEAAFELRDTNLRLVKITGATGKKGRFSGSGTSQLRGFGLESYHLDVFLRDVTISSIPDVVSTQDGKLMIDSQRNTAGRVVPSITGSIAVKQALVTMELGVQEGPPNQATMATDSPSWLCNMSIDAPKNVRLRNADLDMELGGELIMRRDERGFYFRGDLSVLRGAYTLYNNTFQITDGRIDFSKATTLRPDIRLNAYTPHRRAGQEERRIFLNLVWEWDKREPVIALSYDAPGYSQSDLWKMLGGQVVAGDAGLMPGSAFDAGGAAQNLASNYLERILNAQMQDMTVDVETRTRHRGTLGGNGEREMSIAFGRYLSEDVYLKYRQGITYTTEREVDIEYRISNMFLLRSEIIRHSSRGITGKSRQTADEINFDIKFRLEY
ncbi:MAG: translocation/assembly module TamB domain-containing protein [Candidatus Krumholzibacteriia bacterium]